MVAGLYGVAVPVSGWRLCYFPAELPTPSPTPSFSALVLDDWEQWREAASIPVKTPFLLSPSFDYDVALNGFFLSADMIGLAWNTQDGYARDVKAFLNFLWHNRNGCDWRDATGADHVAYLVWRRRDPAGPRVDDSTWDREVTAVNRFYTWQVSARNVAANPIPQRSRRPSPIAGRRGRGEPAMTPATYSHGAGREKIEWLPPSTFRRWRDVGIRGYTPEGLPDNGFRGRWTARNALFCDTMVRTGLRLAEQTALTVFEMPIDRGLGGYQRFWLPKAIAKGGSARWVYQPESLIAEALDYAEIDRAEVIDQARAAGRYDRLRHPFVVEDPNRPIARGRDGHRVKVAHLDPEERLRLLVDGPGGLEPAVFWLSENGTPMTKSAWKDLFRTANRRCRGHGLRIWVHAHLLRHSFAVVTLEQLQRGHLAEQQSRDPDQRRTYTLIFGDPLDWVRRRLGHQSVLSTQIYLHALAELEMKTRMALVPDDWESLGNTPLDRFAVDGAAFTGAPQ
ncbi:tyrosine-type recombinase/integrase [Nocardia sp. 2YAB30]|uniref:tyrosine-type recombinase/integrase n=1 Tax=Nocardia sp. 2YAB30 TaxID=3233022 RepID=UPI003F98AC3E